MFFIDLLAFFLSSLVALALIYYKAPTTVIQQGVALLLAVLLVISKRFAFSQSQVSSRIFRFTMLTLSALFVQLLVISSGGFYSPFLILLHLYTLGTSFLLKIGSAISFLVLSLAVLIASTFLNQTLLSLFKQDPGSVILYLVSFMVIIPLAQFLMRTYHLKDTISKLLTEHIEIGEKREHSILQGLNELVLVTDINFKILSSNEAAEKALIVPGNIIGNNLLSVLHLKDENGDEATVASLSIDKVMEDRATHLVEGFYLETKLAKSLKVTIQISPVTNPEGQINQIVFVINDARATGRQTHSSLDKARQQHSAILQNLMKAVKDAKLPIIEIQAVLLAKAEEDILLAQELEDHPFRKRVSYQDLAEVCQQVIAKKQAFAKLLQVRLQFSLPKEEIKEAVYLNLKQSNLPPQMLALSDFSVPMDAKWFVIILEKLVDISTLLVTGQQSPSVNLSIQRQNSKIIEVFLTCMPVQVNQADSQELFKEYFGTLSKTNLRFGSGLEGSIAKTLSTELNLPIEVQTVKNTLIFKLKLSKELES